MIYLMVMQTGKKHNIFLEYGKLVNYLNFAWG